jgi:hypothetical protein
LERLPPALGHLPAPTTALIGCLQLAALRTRLESFHHRGTSAFDRSITLLNDIVEVPITSDLNILPFRILAPQKPKGRAAGARKSG